MKNLIAYINSTRNNEINNFSNIFPMIPSNLGVGYANDYVAVPRNILIMVKTMMK